MLLMSRLLFLGRIFPNLLLQNVLPLLNRDETCHEWSKFGGKRLLLVAAVHVYYQKSHLNLNQQIRCFFNAHLKRDCEKMPIQNSSTKHKSNTSTVADGGGGGGGVGHGSGSSSVSGTRERAVAD
jgi:hypothetical protein